MPGVRLAELARSQVHLDWDIWLAPLEDAVKVSGGPQLQARWQTLRAEAASSRTESEGS